MPRTRWTAAALPILAIVIGFSAYGLITIASDSRDQSRDRKVELSLQRVHRDLSDQLEALPVVTAPGAGSEIIDGLSSFCAAFRREAPVVSAAHLQLPVMRIRLRRAEALMSRACLFQSRLDKSLPAAELRRASLEFRTTTQQALLEIQTGLVEFSGLTSVTRGDQRFGRLLELLALLGLSSCGLAYLGWQAWGGAKGPTRPSFQTASQPRESDLPGQWMRTAMEASSEGILIVEPEGQIRSANAAAERILGFGRGELVGLELGHIAPNLMSPAESYGILERVVVSNGQGAKSDCQVSWFRRKGVANAPTVVFVQASPPAQIEGAAMAGEPLQAAPTAAATAPGPVELDADALGLLEDEILLVTGFGEVALANLAPDDPARADIEQLTRAAARAAVLCREAAPVLVKSPPEPVRLNAFVSGFEQRLLAMLEPGVDVMVRTDAAAGTVSVNSGILEQALLSLVLHVLPSVPEPRLIRLSTAPGRIEATLHARGAASPPGWRRVLGERKLPKAATWLAAQGATLERDLADRGGAYRFRIRLAPLPASPHSAAEAVSSAAADEVA